MNEIIIAGYLLIGVIYCLVEFLTYDSKKMPKAISIIGPITFIFLWPLAGLYSVYQWNRMIRELKEGYR